MGQQTESIMERTWKAAALAVAALSLLALIGVSTREGGARFALEQGDVLSRMFDKETSDPDVHPIKGEGKLLDEVQHLGDLPDLSLNPHKKEDAVVSAAAQVGIKITHTATTADEKARAAAAVEALMQSAEGKIKVMHKKKYVAPSSHTQKPILR